MNFVLGSHILTEGPWSVTATLYRADRQGEFDAAAISRFKALLPHLQRATQLRARLACADHHYTDFRSALDALDRAAILVDRESRVTFANRAAEELFKGKDLFVSPNQHLSASNPAQTQLLRRTIAECLASGGGNGGASMAIHRTGGRPLTVIVSRSPPVRSIFDVAAALVLIDQPDRLSRPELLRQGHGLTRAEARLAIALLDGRRLREAADDFGVSFATARTHLARIFQKTGVSSQAQLVCLLLKSGFN